METCTINSVTIKPSVWTFQSTAAETVEERKKRKCGNIIEKKSTNTCFLPNLQPRPHSEIRRLGFRKINIKTGPLDCHK